MKCARCGVESGIEDVFTVRKEWAGLVKRAYCPECWEAVYLREQIFSVAGVVLLFLLFDGLFVGRGAASVLLDFLFLGAVNFLLAVAHELSHTAVALLLGVRVFRVIVGFGKPLAARRLFGITWELRPWFFGAGTMMASPPQPGRRWKFFLAVLAGPALHVLLLVVLAAVQFLLLILQGWFGVDAGTLLHLTGLFLFFNLVLLVFNIIPMKAAGPFGQAGSDGLQLLQQLFLKPEQQKAMDQTYYVMEAMDAGSRNENDAALRWVEKGLAEFPDNPALLTIRGVHWIRQKKYAGAREVFLSLLPSQEGQKPLFRNMLLNNIAYADALIRDPELLAEADRYSEEAFRNLAWEPSIIGTRGTVLVETGRLEEGIALLKRALEKQKDAFGKAADAYHIAVGERRRGNAEESRRYFDLARKYDPDIFLFGWEGENQ